MPTIGKVNRSYYQKMKQSEFGEFALLLVKNTEGNPNYKDLAPKVTVLKAAAEKYAKALVAVQSGGRDRTEEKNEAKLEVVESLNKFSDEIDYFANGNVPYVTGTGNKARTTDRNKYEGVLFPPFDIAGITNTSPGCIDLTFKIKNIQKVATQKVMVEYSEDEGKTWVLCTIASAKRRITVTGLPRLKILQFRLCCIGSLNRKSDWSDPIQVAVA